jgi:hypothetical protein
MKLDRMPLHADFFLPARRTDLIALKDVDLDALHRQLWRESNPREMNRVKRPGVNNYLLAILIAQGRLRRKDGRCYVKDPQEWEDEVIDLRPIPLPPGRWRCQFCGMDFENPPKRISLIACWDCSELIGLRTYFDTNLWDEDRNLIR